MRFPTSLDLHSAMRLLALGFQRRSSVTTSLMNWWLLSLVVGRPLVLEGPCHHQRTSIIIRFCFHTTMGLLVVAQARLLLMVCCGGVFVMVLRSCVEEW